MLDVERNHWILKFFKRDISSGQLRCISGRLSEVGRGILQLLKILKGVNNANISPRIQSYCQRMIKGCPITSEMRSFLWVPYSHSAGVIGSPGFQKKSFCKPPDLSQAFWFLTSRNFRFLVELVLCSGVYWASLPFPVGVKNSWAKRLLAKVPGTLKLTASLAPENGWLEYDPFLLGFGLSSGANC